MQIPKLELLRLCNLPQSMRKVFWRCLTKYLRMVIGISNISEKQKIQHERLHPQKSAKDTD